MIGAFNKIVKRLVGDKAASDVQAIQPAIDAIHAFDAEMAQLSADGLRERSADLKRRILAHVDGLVQQSKELKVQVDSNPTMSFEAKEALYEKIDAIEKDIDSGLEEVLEAVMPEGFALLKETARRFAAEGDVQVTASEMDRDLAASRDFVRIEGEQAFWAGASGTRPGRRSSGTWSTTMFSSSAVWPCTGARWPRCRRVREKPLWPRYPCSSMP